jgi:GT2 family glycosyltransferase
VTAPTTPLVTVIIVNYNGAHLLPPCLTALAAQDLPREQFEVWVVDNASHDESVELIERDFPWVRLLRHDRNAGFAGGNNVALREVSTQFVALTNNDARPEPSWLANMIRPMTEPDGQRIGATTGKLIFDQRYVAIELATPAFLPGSLDGRQLGVKVYGVTVDGRDVTGSVLWDNVAYPEEGSGDGTFRWTRPAGRLLLPVQAAGATTGEPLAVSLTLQAEAAKPVEVSWDGGGVTVKTGPERETASFVLPATVPVVDVVQNAGSVVFTNGYGADRGFQEVDSGQWETPEPVFAFCGASVCFRLAALRDVGFFDDDFFMYYEDTDLSWRLQSRGWSIRYTPEARARHLHAASSVEWSPFFTFHVDRNRLLVLTKNARPSFAAREVLRYPATTASLALRELSRARRVRRRPAVRPTLLRLRVTGSYLRLLPAMLARRRSIRTRATVSRQQLEPRLTRPPGPPG